MNNIKTKLFNCSFVKNGLIRTLFSYFGLVLIVVMFSILTHGDLLKENNIKLILDQMIVLMLSCIGVFFVMTLGGLDFSQGSILGLSSIAVAYFSQTSIVLGVIAGIVVGALIGFLNGILHVKLKVLSFIVTICTMFIFRGVCAFLTTTAPIKASYDIFDYDELSFKLPIILLILLVTAWVVRYSKFFKQCKAIGAGEKAAKFAGVKVKKIKVIVFTLAGLMAGFAAFFNVIKVGSITATSGSLLETNVMIALVLGGLQVSGGSKVKFSSVIIGCLIFSIMGNGLVLLQVLPNVQQLIRGLIFLVVVALTINRKSASIIK